MPLSLMLAEDLDCFCVVMVDSSIVVDTALVIVVRHLELSVFTILHHKMLVEKMENKAGTC